MNRTGVVLILILLGSVAGLGQGGDDVHLQIHGFATQAFAYSGANNYLGMNTAQGTTGWTEAAVNVNDQVNEKLRVGAQFHYTRLGNFGQEEPTVDWALGDYKASGLLGLRAGKVKIRWGLYNDTQDYDPGYLWALLPEPVYGIDIRSTNLSQLGVEVYGRLPIGEKFGTLSYSGYYGDYVYVSGEGEMEAFKESGLTFDSPPAGKTPGFDLRWMTPLTGLTVGGSLMMFDATANLAGETGTYRQPLAFWPTYYAQYINRKLFLSYQYTKLVEYQTTAITGAGTSTSDSDTSAWYVMG